SQVADARAFPIGAQAWEATWITSDRHDSPDATEVISRADVERAIVAREEVLRMLDHLSDHVRDPERSVGPRAKRGRAKPRIARREELAPLLAVRASAREGRPVLLDHDAMDEVVDGLAHECVAPELGAEEIVA